MSFAYMPFYTGDYYRDTRHLSMLQHGAYRQLLDHCWDQKGPLPLDETRCYRICGAVSKEEQDAVRSVIDEFFTRMEDGHYNRRMQLEIEKCNAISGVRAGAAHARWAARESIQRIDAALHDANAMQVHSKSNASGPSPSPSPSPEPIKTSNLKVASTQAHLDCPHLHVLELWAEVLPDLPRHDPEQWRGARADHLRSRWRETATLKKWQNEEAGLTYFRKLFSYVGQSEFLTGKAKSRDGKRPFVIELEWLVKPINWAKVIEGKYHAEVTA
jgi:uncharacterized protein YdaU (DUF1376 family)